MCTGVRFTQRFGLIKLIENPALVIEVLAPGQDSEWSNVC
jgi:hypothetical protein